MSRREFNADARFVLPGDITRGVRRASKLGPPEIIMAVREDRNDVEIAWLLPGTSERGVTSVPKTRKVTIRR